MAIEDASDSPSLKTRAKMVAKGLCFSTELMAYGLLFSIFAVIPQLLMRFRGNLECDVDVTGKICMESMSCKALHADVVSTFVCHQFRYRMGVDSVALYVLMPLAVFLSYLKLRWTQILLMVLGQMSVYFLIVGVMYLNRDQSVADWTVLCTPVSFLLPYVISKTSLGMKNTFVPRLAVKLLMVTVCASWMLLLYDHMIGVQLWFVLVVYPICKVAMSTFARSNSREMVTHKPRPGEPGLRREYSLMFVQIIQIFFATFYRMVISSIDTNLDFAIFMVISTIQEIAMRLTFPLQDDLLAKLANKCMFWKKPKRYRETMIAPVSGAILASSQTKTKIDSEKMVKAEWMSIVLSSEMLAEYVGMFVSTITALMFMNERFSLPLPIFRTQTLGEPFDIADLFAKLGVQIIGELLVDTLCLVFEESLHKFPIREGWKAQRWIPTILTYSISGYIGLSITVLFLHSGSWGTAQTKPCEDVNICSCAPPPFNVYGRVCAILYPHGYNSSIIIDMTDPLFDDL